jgi:hypothetical protein
MAEREGFEFKTSHAVEIVEVKLRAVGDFDQIRLGGRTFTRCGGGRPAEETVCICDARQP